MKLLINLSGNYVGGGFQVALSFLNECKTIVDNQYYVFLGHNFFSQVDKRTFPDNFVFYDIPKCKLFQLHSILSPLEDEINPDVVFSVFGPRYWHSKSPHVMGYALPHYIYKDSPYFAKIGVKEKIKIWIREKFHLYFLNRDADVLICETDDVNIRVTKLFPQKKIFTVSNTFGSHYGKSTEVTEKKSKYSKYPNKFRLLLLSKYYPHKNIELIKDIVIGLNNIKEHDIQFVLTITDSEYQAIFDQEYADEVITVGPTSAIDCPILYESCDAIFLPTLLECYSANYPEAMIMKKPILTSDLGFAKAVCDDAALYFDPVNVDDIIEKIVTLRRNRSLQDELIKRGSERVKSFPTSRQRAEQYLMICKSLMK